MSDTPTNTIISDMGTIVSSDVSQLTDNTIIELPTTSAKKLRTQLETKMDIINAEIFTINDVHNILKETHNYSESHYSTICDLVATYLKGQKILYIESKSICEQRLNILMLPTILVTALCSILSLLLKDGTEGPIIVSCLSGFNVFILAVINYLKLDARAEAHRISAYKFDKMESELVFNSGKMLFIQGVTNELPQIIINTEKNVKEVKETNQFILPEKIRFGFPVTCNTNVFVEVKHIQNKEATLISAFKDVLNSIVKIQNNITNSSSKSTADLEVKLDILKKEKKELFDKIIYIRDEYLKIDDMFEKEIAEYQKRNHSKCNIFNCLKN